MTKPKKENSLIKRIFKDNSYCWLACLCTVGVMMLVYYCYNLFPFGETTILRMAEIQRRAFNEDEDVDKLIQAAEAMLYDISQHNIEKDFTPISDVLPTVKANYEAASNNKERTLLFRRLYLSNP